MSSTPQTADSSPGVTSKSKSAKAVVYSVIGLAAVLAVIAGVIHSPIAFQRPVTTTSSPPPTKVESEISGNPQADEPPNGEVQIQANTAPPKQSPADPDLPVSPKTDPVIVIKPHPAPVPPPIPDHHDQEGPPSLPPGEEDSVPPEHRAKIRREIEKAKREAEAEESRAKIEQDWNNADATEAQRKEKLLYAIEAIRQNPELTPEQKRIAIELLKQAIRRQRNRQSRQNP